MTFFNRFTVFSKRILTRKVYLLMLAFIIAITAVYKLLPERSSSADIRVALYSMDESEYTYRLFNKLEHSNSLYKFYVAQNETDVINDVKSGKAECGYIIPQNFFTDYIKGNAEDSQIIQYVIPSTTLGATINETVFSNIFSLCADEILILGVDIPEYNTELSERISNYMNSDEIFKISDITSGEFAYDELTYHINIPVYEIALLLTIFSGLLGLLIYMQDYERGIYIALGKWELAEIKSISILTAIFPILLTGLAASAITYGFSVKLLYLSFFGLIIYAAAFLLGFIIKKSTRLTKVLPLTMLFASIIIFIAGLK